MQYTASSFADTLVGQLGFALRPEEHRPQLHGPFPPPAAFTSHVPDAVLDSAIVPAFRGAGRLFARLRPIQRGKLHLYLLYILGALVALLLWR
jgi:hydrogenase-4 component B